MRRVRAGELRANPRNWRVHPQRQRAALAGVLDEVGYADALLARELSDGSLQLIDGHLRAETTPEAVVPVLVLDLDDCEADKLLAVLDPLAALAETNGERLAELVAGFETQSAALADMLNEVAAAGRAVIDAGGDGLEAGEPALPAASYQVVVECDGEAEQESLFDRLRGEGHRCRVLTL